MLCLCFNNCVAEPQTEEDQQAVLKYDEWLRQNDVWLLSSIQSLEQQVAKYRRTKKALNAKQRVVCGSVAYYIVVIQLLIGFVFYNFI